jgi:hypothetical protein
VLNDNEHATIGGPFTLSFTSLLKYSMRRVLLAIMVVGAVCPIAAADGLKIATFQADITPPLGSPLCDGLVPPARKVDDPLSARGIVLFSAEEPIVLCALDWVGVGNGGYDRFREVLAKAAGTKPNRVALHSLHQHDAPGCDFEADKILQPFGLENELFNVAFAYEAIERVASAVEKACRQPQPVSHISLGKAQVEMVASNRRVMGPDGKVKHVRYSASRDAAIRAEPEGTIDPFVHLVGFWNGERPVASLTYYATHPQSYYGQGSVSCDFPGLARNARDQQTPEVLHVHFNGAGGNVTAGKYNDGSPENRPVLAQRLNAGMQSAWNSAERIPLTATDIAWRIEPVALPAASHLDEAALRSTLQNTSINAIERLRAARNLAWLVRCQQGHKIDVTCLQLGPAAILHLPGELFVEYQLAAQAMRPKAPVMMAAYGDYGPGYIGTKISYTQGGYETGPVSRVAPEAEDALLDAIRKLLR